MAQPIVHNPNNPLPLLRYTNPNKVPSNMLPPPSSSSSTDEDSVPVLSGRRIAKKPQKAPREAPVAQRKKSVKRKRSARHEAKNSAAIPIESVERTKSSKPKASNSAKRVRTSNSKAPKENKEQAASKRSKHAPKMKMLAPSLKDPHGFAKALVAGTYVLCHGLYAGDRPEDPDRPGFSICVLTGEDQGTKEAGCWGFKHWLSSKKPWKKSIVDAKFGVGRGCIVDGGTAVVHTYQMVSAWRSGLLKSGKLSVDVQKIIKEHADWSSLEDG